MSASGGRSEPFSASGVLGLVAAGESFSVDDVFSLGSAGSGIEMPIRVALCEGTTRASSDVESGVLLAAVKVGGLELAGRGGFVELLEGRGGFDDLLASWGAVSASCAGGAAAGVDGDEGVTTARGALDAVTIGRGGIDDVALGRGGLLAGRGGTLLVAERGGTLLVAERGGSLGVTRLLRAVSGVDFAGAGAAASTAGVVLGVTGAGSSSPQPSSRSSAW